MQTYAISKSQQFFHTFAPMLKRFFQVFFGILVFTAVSGQDKLTIKKDLKAEWLQFDGTAYVPAAPEVNGVRSIHFILNTGQYPRHTLELRSRKPFFLFVNGKLLRERDGTMMLPLDSLANALGETVFNFTIYQDAIDHRDLQTRLLAGAAQKRGSGAMEAKPASFFRDFVVLAGLMLTVFFVVMVRMQPKLASDYFSVRRIVSLREGDDNQAHARFAISSNLWFYIFCSMLIALFLLILFYHLPDEYLITIGFDSNSFWGIFADWIKLSFVVVSILLIKIVLIFLLANLFGLRGIAGVHFFNGIRLLLIVTSSLSVILFVYFIWRGQDFSVYTTFLFILVFTFVAWIGLVFFKLSNRVEHSMFHLFSYICATEVIPLLITVKVLFQ
jgi:hypothetical protein